MKSRVVIGTCLALAAMAVLLPSGLRRTVQAQNQNQGAGSGAPPLSNPLKVALLKWYNANTVPTEFLVGKEPEGIAFDGANIWTANFGDGTVSKVQASDGALLGTFTVGGSPIGIVFDGANLWVTNNSGTNITKLRASDGKILGNFTVTGGQMYWPAFDGANVWVATARSSGNGAVNKVRASDGKIVGTFPVGPNPGAVAFDGADVWVTNGAMPRLRRCGPVTGRRWVRSMSACSRSASASTGNIFGPPIVAMTRLPSCRPVMVRS